MNQILFVGGIVFIAAVVGCLSILWLGKDNPVEEECEKIIKDQTGKEVDLSGPDSK